MKYSKKRGRYEASNVSYDPDVRWAYSYDWWKFVTVIDGLTIFNWYNYSSSTRKHQYKVAQLMRDLGHNIDVEVSIRPTLSDRQSLIGHEQTRLKAEIATFQAAIATKGSRKVTNAKRKMWISQLTEQLIEFNKKMGVDEYSLIFDNVLNQLDKPNA